MSYMVDKPPNADPIMQRQVRVWEPKEHRPTLTWSRSGFKTYSTCVSLKDPRVWSQLISNRTKNKYFPWTPVAKPRQ